MRLPKPYPTPYTLHPTPYALHLKLSLSLLLSTNLQDPLEAMTDDQKCVCLRRLLTDEGIFKTKSFTNAVAGALEVCVYVCVSVYVSKNVSRSKTSTNAVAWALEVCLYVYVSVYVSNDISRSVRVFVFVLVSVCKKKRCPNSVKRVVSKEKKNEIRIKKYK